MSDHTNNALALCLGGVCFTAESVFEGSVIRPRTVAPRAHIRSLRLRYGFRARHPWLLALFGLVLIALGIAPLFHAGVWFLGGGIFVAKEAFLLVWLLLGLAALYQAFRRGHVLDIETAVGLRCFEFAKSVNPLEVEEFLDQVEKSFGYTIARPVLRQ